MSLATPEKTRTLQRPLYVKVKQRSALDAVQTVYKAIDEGHTEIVDADLSKYFDLVPHSPNTKGDFQIRTPGRRVAFAGDS